MKFTLQWNAGEGLISHLPEFKQFIQKSLPLIAVIQDTHFRDTFAYNYDIPRYPLPVASSPTFPTFPYLFCKGVLQAAGFGSNIETSSILSDFLLTCRERQICISSNIYKSLNTLRCVPNKKY